MDPDIFCVLCGGPFDLEQGVHNIDPEKTSFQWLYDARMLGTLSALRNHRMTTEGEMHLNLSDSPHIFLSERIRWAATDANCLRLGDSFYNVLVDDEAGDVVFPLHYACIQIGCRMLHLRDPDRCDKLRSCALACLYYTLRRRYWHANSAGGGVNDIFALRTISRTFGPRSTLALDELGWWGGAYEKFLTDPVDIPNLAASAFNLLQPLSIGFRKASTTATAHVPPRGLEALPSEILEHIADFLPPISVMSLCRTSRSLTLKIPLDDRFWRRHLCSGSLLPYLWDLDEAELKQLLQRMPTDLPWNWRNLARRLRIDECLKWGQDPLSGEVPDGLWNRYRIWSILEEGCIRLNPETQIVLTVPRHRLETGASKGDVMRALGLGFFALLFALVAAYDLNALRNAPSPQMTPLTLVEPVTKRLVAVVRFILR